jgi:hypothetical protein
LRIDRRLVGFGLFLVTIGLVMVAVRQGLIPVDTARRAWNLWPLLLIGVGLSIILAGRPGTWVGGVIVAMTFGTMVGAIAGTGAVLPIGLCSGNRDHGTAFAQASGDLSASATVSIEQDCGDLHVATAPGARWTLGGVSSDGRPPAIKASPGELRITTGSGGPFDLGGSTAWDLTIPTAPAVALDVQANAGDAQLHLAGANLASVSVQRNAGSVAIDLRETAAVGSLDLEVNAGSATLWLPNRTVSGNLTVNAGSIALCLPAGAGLRVSTGGNVAASNDFDAHGLVRSGDTWATPGFASATVRVDLTADANAASLSIDPSACTTAG